VVKRGGVEDQPQVIEAGEHDGVLARRGVEPREALRHHRIGLAGQREELRARGYRCGGELREEG
jgi:hypothetical protein